LRINLGCGDRYVPGWTNVDLATMPHRKDQTVDLTGDLPWQPGTIGAVYAGHVLEHLTQDAAQRLLTRLLPLMAPPGPIMIVGPDIDRARALLPDGVADQYGATLDNLRHGGQRWPGDEHHWDCTPELLETMLENAGWSLVSRMSVQEAALQWPVADPRPTWQCAVGALAPLRETL